MTDNELLLAISNIMDKKIEPLQGEIGEMKGEIVEMKGDITKLQGNYRKISLQLENNVIPHLNELSSCYTSTF